MRQARLGFALFLTLLVLLLTAVGATALLFIGTQELRLAHARAHALLVRLAAEAGARAALAAWHSSTFARLEPGAELDSTIAGTLGDARYAARVRRLDAELFLVLSEGTVPVAPRADAHARVGLLVRVLEEARVWRSSPSALTTGGAVQLLGGTRLDSADPTRIPDNWPAERCANMDSLLNHVFGTTEVPGILAADTTQITIGVDASVVGSPPVALDTSLADSAAFAAFGPVDWAMLPALADRSESGTLYLAPAEQDGACDTAAPANWGDPLEPAAPCGNYFPLIYAADDLDIAGGAGQGVLVVNGNLSIRGGAAFYGLILVRGTLAADGGASIEGAARVRAADTPVRLTNTLIAYNACAISRALAPALERPFRPSGRAWIPLF